MPLIFQQSSRGPLLEIIRWAFSLFLYSDLQIWNSSSND